MSVHCSYCGSENTQSRGVTENGLRRRLYCKDCGRYPTVDVEDDVQMKKEFKNMLVFDIETSLKKAFLFHSGKQYVGGNSFIDDDLMLSWSAKTLGSSEIFSDVLSSKEARNRNHSRITKSLWDLMRNYDITVGYNQLGFDNKMINTFFLMQKLGLPNRYRHIDLYQIMKNNFKFDSYALNFVCKKLGLNEGKIVNEPGLWEKCYYAETDEPLKQMEFYNRNDVVITEDLFHVVKGYIPRFPNLSIYDEIEQCKCPYCKNLEMENNGFWYTPNGKFNSYKCLECGGIFRSKKNLISNKGIIKSQMVVM